MQAARDSTDGILQDLTSGDAHRIWRASGAINALYDRAALSLLATHLEEIRNRTNDVPLGGALFSNAEHLKLALRKLELIRDGRECLCRLYSTYLMYDPGKLQEAGQVHIDETIRQDGQWNIHYRCTCRHCGASFMVEEGEYHYTWWQWRPLATGQPP